MTEAPNPGFDWIKWNTMAIEDMTKLSQSSVIIGGVVGSKESYMVLQVVLLQDLPHRFCLIVSSVWALKPLHPKQGSM
jgi:hypothetical protein